MEYDAVLNRFILLTDIDSIEAADLSYVINDAMEEISEMLLPDSETEESSRRITAAAAALAAYRFREIVTARGDCDGFKAGDVTISSGERSLAAARRIFEESLSRISDLVQDDYFIFRGVSGKCMPEQSTE